MLERHPRYNKYAGAGKWPGWEAHMLRPINLILGNASVRANAVLTHYKRRRAWKNFSQFALQAISLLLFLCFSACYCCRNYSKLPCSTLFELYLRWLDFQLLMTHTGITLLESLVGHIYWSAYWLCACGCYGLLRGQTALHLLLSRRLSLLWLWSGTEKRTKTRCA